MDFIVFVLINLGAALVVFISYVKAKALIAARSEMTSVEVREANENIAHNCLVSFLTVSFVAVTNLAVVAYATIPPIFP